jgi:membrane protein DedA with SNARE-associated domain
MWAAAVRIALGIAVIPVAPALLRDHFVALVLLRPTKEVLLLGGFLTREGDVSAAPILGAAIPLAVLGVWHFYLLGRAYCDELASADLPGLPGRILSPRRIEALREELCERGAWVVLVGRLAVFPSSLMAAAAGSSEMPSRRFFAADGAGALLSVGEAYGAGLLLGEAYGQAGPWLTAVGVVAMAAIVIWGGRRLGAHR